MSIRQRVALQITAVLLAAFVIVTAVTSWTTLITVEDSLDADRNTFTTAALADRAKERKLLVSKGAGAFLLALHEAAGDERLPVTGVTFVDPIGRETFNTGPHLALPVGNPSKVRPSDGHYESDVAWGDATGPRGRVALQFALPDPPPIGAILNTTLATNGIIFGLCAVLLVASTYFLLDRAVLKPLDSLTTASSRVAQGDYDVQVEVPDGQDEIAALARTFNQMTGEVREYHTEMERRVLEAAAKIRATERKMVLTQRLASMGTLAAGIAHEVNNPIGGMINAARRLQKDVPEGRPATYVELIVDGLERVQNIVKQVLSFTPRTVHPEMVDVPDIVRKAVELSRHRLTHKDIVLNDELPALPQIVGEPGELQQVFLNLIVNAADATDRRGTITLAGRPVSGAVEIDVIDTGSGMSEEQISRAFDIFYTTKGQGEGSGLGLPIVHNIVQSHGGSIEFHSTQGVGTTVRCRFPLPDAPGGESRRLIAKQPPAQLGP